MLKIIIGGAIVVWFISSAVSGHDADVAQVARSQRQTEILLAMEAQHDAGVSRLLEEWRAEHAEPSTQDLEELRILAERVKADPVSAVRYTAEAKQAHLSSLPFEPAIGGWSTQHVGLGDPAPEAASAATK